MSRFVPVEQYLTTRYEPDCDYVHGELVERAAGLFPHSNAMTEVAVYLRTRYEAAGYIALPIVRVHMSASLIRVADVCVVRRQRPLPRRLDTPPLVAIEILSPEDRADRMFRKLEDFLAFGVPNVWVIDPEERRAFIHTRDGYTESKDLVLRAKDCEIVLPLAEVFANLQ